MQNKGEQNMVSTKQSLVANKKLQKIIREDEVKRKNFILFMGKCYKFLTCLKIVTSATKAAKKNK